MSKPTEKSMLVPIDGDRNGNNSDDSEIKIFSLNCWGLIWSKKRKKRFQYISKYLQDPLNYYDFVALQEVWCRSDYQQLQQSLKALFPHTTYFPNGVIGSGLAIFSRYPIIQSFFKRFSLCGAPDRFWHGDFYSGKGIGGIRVLWNGLFLNVYTTHMHAEYSHHKMQYQAHRLTQMEEIVQFVEQSSRPSHLSIVAGDLNTRPDEFVYRMMLVEGCANRFDLPLRDAWPNQTLNNSNANNNGSNAPTGGKSLDASSPPRWIEEGLTCNTPANSFSKTKNPGQRIDYILFAPRDGFVCKEVKVITDDSPYEANLSFSDHHPVQATFRVADPSALHKLDRVDYQGIQLTPQQLLLHKEFVEEAIDILTRDRERVKFWQKIYIAMAIIFLLVFIGLTITTAVTIPNDQLTPLLILALFGIQPAVLVTMFGGIIMARLFLQEERSALTHFINGWKIWLLHYEQLQENLLSATP